MVDFLKNSMFGPFSCLILVVGYAWTHRSNYVIYYGVIEGRKQIYFLRNLISHHYLTNLRLTWLPIWTMILIIQLNYTLYRDKTQIDILFQGSRYDKRTHWETFEGWSKCCLNIKRNWWHGTQGKFLHGWLYILRIRIPHLAGPCL